VTGYGLLGHLRSMLRASGVAATIEGGAAPLLPGAAELAEAGHVPGGTGRNLADLEEDVTWAESVAATTRILLADAQTSGGLLLAVRPERTDELLAALDAGGAPAAAVVGEIVEGRPGRIEVR
jgi:selenide,water dikinase